MSAMQPVRMVVMGVSGCGKSTVGLMLAQALGLPYVEGDDLHSPENVERMLQSIGQHVAVAPPEVVEAHLTAAGFSAPTRCFQTLWIHGWVSRRA